MSGEYKLLVNETYLYLLQHPEIRKINMTQIGKAIGKSAKTVGKEYESFIYDEGRENKFEIQNFYNDVDDKYERAMLILNDIAPEYDTQLAIADALGISNSCLSRHKIRKIKKEGNVEKAIGGVFAIKDDFGEIIYIEATDNYKVRKSLHSNKIRERKIDIGLYEYCIDNDLYPEDLTFELITEFKDKTSKEQKKKTEEDLIEFFNPICNNI